MCIPLVSLLIADELSFGLNPEKRRKEFDRIGFQRAIRRPSHSRNQEPIRRSQTLL